MRTATPLLALLALAGGARAEDEWTLFRSLARHATVELVVEHPELIAAATRAAERTSLLSPREVRVVAPAASGAGMDAAGNNQREVSDGKSPRVVIGLLSEPWIRDLARELGFVATLGAPGDGGGAEEIAVFGRPFDRADDVLIATVADPERARLPLSIFLAHEPGVLAAQLDDVAPAWRLGVSVWRGGALAFRVPLFANGEADWPLCEDYIERRLAQEPPALLGFAGVSIQISPDIPAARAERYGKLLADVRAKALRELRAASHPERLDVRVYGHPEELVYLHGPGPRSRAFAARPGHAVALVSDGVPHDGGACAAQAVALQLFGAPAVDWIQDGVGAAFAETWWGWPMGEWVGFVAAAGLAPSAAELIAPGAAQRLSPHILGPLRGLLVRHLLDVHGPHYFARVWRGEEELAAGEELDRAFQERVEAVRALLAERVGRERESRRAALDPDAWRAGIHLGPERGDADAPLLARKVRESLARARELGADAVAFSPLVFVEPRQVRFAGEPRGAWPDAEPGDLALATAAGEARLGGMRVMIAPQVIAAAAGTWLDGAGVSGEPEDVESFFATYADVLLHYALLGELLGADTLCLGNERGAVSRTLPPADRDPEDAPGAERRALLQEGWTDLIARVRRAFSGLLTYAAGPGREIHEIGFWSELDLVGVDFFPRLGSAVSAVSERPARMFLAGSLRQCAEVARAAGRPLLLVQTGFPSHADAGSRPDAPGEVTDLAVQQRILALLDLELDALAREERVAGLYLWKWDPDPRGGGAGHAGFTPQGKPAEAVLPGLLSK